MNRSKMFRITVAALCALLPAIVAASTAHADPIKLTSIAKKNVVLTNAAGDKMTKTVPAGHVIPGEEVIYTTFFTNTGKQAATKVVITNPVPEHTVYKAESASGTDTDITFSVDDGNSFAAPDKLMVTGKDGKQRVAKASEYTNIRWEYLASLAAGDKSSVQFNAVLR